MVDARKIEGDTARMAFWGAILIAPTNRITPTGLIIRIPSDKNSQALSMQVIL
jgi:hypothetical protein